MSGKMNVLWKNVNRTRWVGLALLALVAGLALLATPTPVMAQEPVDRGDYFPDVWDPDPQRYKWVNGLPWGYVEGDTAAMAAVSYTHLTLPTTPYV